MTPRAVKILALLAALLLTTVDSAAQQRRPPPQTAPVAILSAGSAWRAHHTLKPPVIQFEDGPRPLLVQRSWLDRETPGPPADWTATDFDDSRWLRTPARTACATPYLARLCLRGRFVVDDPAKVGELTFSLTYHGGAVVYVNGQEVARDHLPAGAWTGAALADPYPRAAFAGDGKLLPAGRGPQQAGLRERSIARLPIPAALLRPGVNVLAVEVVRAPYHQVVDELKDTGSGGVGRGTPYEITWNTCEVEDVLLTARSADGLTANAPPPGLQLSSGDLLAWDSESDFAAPGEPLRPVTIVAARGGTFSGKFLAAVQGPLRGLKVAAPDLKADDGQATLPAALLRVRYAVPWEPIQRYATRPEGYDILLERPLGEFPPGRAGRTVVPVWITVSVPAATAPGTYRGELAVEAAGEQPRSVPLEVRVIDWSLPEAGRWRTWVELIQSPDTLAVEYGVPLWSERHWQLIARSMDFLNQIGSRTVYVPLICHTNFGNEQSMVRWVRRDGDRWDWDFSIMDRYLDLAEKHMGRPKLVCFNVWDIYLRQPASDSGGGYYGDQNGARYALRGKGAAVTVLDPASGGTETVYLPRFEDPASRALWQPLFVALGQRMRQRGLEDVMMLGMFWELWPSKAEVEFFRELSGGLPWVNLSHLARTSDLYNGAGQIGYAMKAFGLEYNEDPARGHSYGWRRSDLLVEYHRFGYWNTSTPATIRYDAEFNITGQQRGVGRLGGDYWMVTRDKEGRRSGFVVERYPESKWRNWDIASWLLAPGPEGPVATARFENVREGLQECEARIYIEAALTAEPMVRARLSDDLARRCQEALDARLLDLWTGTSTLQLGGGLYDYATFTPHRSETFSQFGVGRAGQAWFLGSGWLERSQKLYALAAEVAERLNRH